MMTCRQCQGIKTIFNRRVAARELDKYRQRGPARTTRLLLAALNAEDVQGMTLLDIGGGIGAIQHELLNAGVTHARGVEAAPAYIEAARAEAERQGHADRLAIHHGDFVELAPDMAPADIVTLDRVICCYPDMPALVALSAARAKRLYGLVYPRDTWWMKLGMPLVNVLFWLTRNPFRIFLHATAAVDAVARDNGLHRHSARATFIWQVVVYVRA